MVKITGVGKRILENDEKLMNWHKKTRYRMVRARVYMIIGGLLAGWGAYTGVRDNYQNFASADELANSNKVVANYVSAYKGAEAIKNSLRNSLQNSSVSRYIDNYPWDIRESVLESLLKERERDRILNKSLNFMEPYAKSFEEEEVVKEYNKLRKIEIKPYILPTAGGLGVACLSLSFAGYAVDKFLRVVPKIFQRKKGFGK